MSKPSSSLLSKLLGSYATRLKFPQLFAFVATLFLLDLLIPDLIPFVDEILLGLATLLVGSLQNPPAVPQDKPPIKDVTPPES